MQKEDATHEIEVEFSQLVLSFCTLALRCLGEVAGSDEKGEVDLPTARYNIAILTMLKDKTRGNLSDGEEHQLNELLSDLQLKYAATANKKDKDGV